MSKNGKKQNGNNLGEQFKDTVQDALASGDFSALNDLVSNTVSVVVSEAGRHVKMAADEIQGNFNRQKPGMRRFLPEKIKTREVGKVSSVLYMVFGGIGTGLAALALFAGFIFSMVGFSWSVPTVVVLMVVLAGFVLMVRKGIVENGRLKRMKRYVELCAGRMYMPLEDLARYTNKSPKYMLKDVRKMLELGFFPEGHLDHQETCLILSDKAYQNYLNIEQERRIFQEQEEARIKEQEEEARKKEEWRAKYDFHEELQEMIEEGHRYISRIRRMNDKIDGQVISDKLYCMENLLKEIFERLEECPEQMPKMKKLMNYYLPTTLKLVEAYEDFDSVSTPGENITSAKMEIEKTLDTINEAYKELLNKLFLEDTLDVTTDAQVLKTMLAKEGLTK